MSERLRIKRLRGGSILKIHFIGSCISLTLLATLAAVPAIFGAEIVKWNDEYVTGLPALFAAPLLGLLLGSIWGVLLGLAGYVGLRIFSKFSDMDIEYLPADSPKDQ